jgi:uncharacterized membrane protein YkoI
MKLRILVIAVAVAGLTAGQSVLAQTDAVSRGVPRWQQISSPRPLQRAKFTLDQAVDKVRAKFGGKVIKASTRQKNGRPVHSIKILGENGRVRTVRIDGLTGEFL